ncbi:MAG: PstS family phosphate ABC transporter substrate-binding protein [Chitinophagales bacterium]|jgi:phosphate transport system substrate-binding protein
MKNLALLLSTLLFASSCEQKRPDGKELDGPTFGEISILVDEGYEPVITSVIDVFDTIYGRAKINARYVPESEAVNALLNDSVEVIIIPRSLKEQELAYYKKKGIVPKMTLIAHDAVAFIINPANKDSVLTVDQIKGIMTGEITSWKQINPKSSQGNITIVFDNANSSNVRYCRDSIAGGAALPNSASAVKTNSEVIDYVSKNKGAIGIIGANWISDSDDKGVQSFLKNIVLVDVASQPGAEGFGPYQAYLATKQYPFRRSMHLINCQGRAGLGLGLASFLASDPGQRIMMKEGLLAANIPIRLMQVIKE